MRDIPRDSEGRPLAWPDPDQSDWWVDAWNGIYPGRVWLDAEIPDWTADEADRVLAHGERLITQAEADERRSR